MKKNITLKKLSLSCAILLSIIGTSQVGASTFDQHNALNNVTTRQIDNVSKTINTKKQGDLPLNTPLLLKGFNYSGDFLGYLGLTSYLNWNYLYMDNSYTKIYLEDAGNGKVYMKCANPDWKGYEYVAISTLGYLYLGIKHTAESFSIITENDPTHLTQKMYEFVDSHNRAIGMYDKYITVGSGSSPTLWKVKEE